MSWKKALNANPREKKIIITMKILDIGILCYYWELGIRETDLKMKVERQQGRKEVGRIKHKEQMDRTNSSILPEQSDV